MKLMVHLLNFKNKKIKDNKKGKQVQELFQDEVKDILYQQLQLLAEKSKDIDIETLIDISRQMDIIADTLLKNYSSD